MIGAFDMFARKSEKKRFVFVLLLFLKKCYEIFSYFYPAPIILSSTQEAASAAFTSGMTHALFQALDKNGDGFVCAQDIIECYLKLKAACTDGAIGSRDLNLSSYEIMPEEVSAFLRTSSIAASSSFDSVAMIGSMGSGNSDDGLFDRDISAMDNGTKSNVLNEDGLAKYLALFPAFAFDWYSPLSPGTKVAYFSRGGRYVHSSPIDHESAAILFKRLDSNNDSLVTAEHVRAWRRVLPLGRSEDDLVHSFLQRVTRTCLV